MQKYSLRLVSHVHNTTKYREFAPPFVSTLSRIQLNFGGLIAAVFYGVTDTHRLV